MRLTQHIHHPTQADFDRLAHWIVVFPASARDGRWPDLPYGDLMRQRHSRRFSDQAGGSPLLLELPNALGTQVSLALVAENASAFQELTWGRKLFAELKDHRPREVGVYLTGFEPGRQTALAERLLAAILAGATDLPTHKSTPPSAEALDHVEFFGLAEKSAFASTLAAEAGNRLARELANSPPNMLTPGRYRQQLEVMSQEQNWRMKVYASAALRELHAGAFLAVTRGSENDEAAIVRLNYLPPQGSSGRKVALVGKGICFDTGGHHLKSTRGMQYMHEDMLGSAVALGTLLALTQMGVDFEVECWLALASNHIGPNAYLPHDVVTAANGTRVEIVHTDAEGRLVLADTLALASREQPDLIMDYATLTGSCIAALGTRYSGFMTNREDWLPLLMAAGQECGERVWPFPQDTDYDEELDSEIADIKQCLLDNDADHILAGRFLSRFVKNDLPWIHFDLSSGRHEEGLAHIPTAITGFGVRYSVHLLTEKSLLSKI